MKFVIWALLSSLVLWAIHRHYTAAGKQCHTLKDLAPLINASQGPFQLITVNVKGRSIDAFILEVDNSVSKAPPVLLLHGFPDNLHSFKHQQIALAAAGHSSIAPSLSGYSESERASAQETAEYSVDVLALQLLRLLASDELAPLAAAAEGMWHIVGHDWGSLIVALAAKVAPPGYVKTVTLMAIPDLGSDPVGLVLRGFPGQLVRSWYVIFFQFPWLPEWWLSQAGGMETLWSHWGLCFSQERLVSVKATISGARLSSALGYYRANILPMLIPVFMRSDAEKSVTSRPIPQPTLLLGGKEDGCFGADLFAMASQPERFASTFRFEQLEGAGHFLHHEQPDRVSELLVDFISHHSAL